MNTTINCKFQNQTNYNLYLKITRYQPNDKYFSLVQHLFNTLIFKQKLNELKKELFIKNRL